MAVVDEKKFAETIAGHPVHHREPCQRDFQIDFALISAKIEQRARRSIEITDVS